MNKMFLEFISEGETQTIKTTNSMSDEIICDMCCGEDKG
jgi:hypothetical protein